MVTTMLQQSLAILNGPVVRRAIGQSSSLASLQRNAVAEHETCFLGVRALVRKLQDHIDARRMAPDVDQGEGPTFAVADPELTEVESKFEVTCRKLSGSLNSASSCAICV